MQKFVFTDEKKPYFSVILLRFSAFLVLFSEAISLVQIHIERSFDSWSEFLVFKMKADSTGVFLCSI